MPKSKTSRVPPGFSERGASGLLFVCALAIRLLYALELSRRSPFWGHPYLDAKYYLDWAREILG